MATVSPAQALSIITALSDYQGLARPDREVYEHMLDLNWMLAAGQAGLRGRPQNEWNSLVQHSRLFEGTSLTGETSLGLFLRDTEELFLAFRPGPQTAFRLRMPEPFRNYRHCTDPLTLEGPTLLHTHHRDASQRVRKRTFVRLSDLWRRNSIDINRGRMQAFVERPAVLATWGGLNVTRAFDCDLPYSSTPWARFILGGSGLEEAAAARSLGMEWILATENPDEPAGSVMTHRLF